MEYLYCAAFEKKVAKDYRAILLNDVNKLLNNSDVVVLSSRLAYIGPYYFETDGMLDQDIVEMEKRQIERWVYAASLQKRVFIYYVKNEKETESALHSPFWYPIILSSKINSYDVDLIACDSFSEARDNVLKMIKGQMLR